MQKIKVISSWDLGINFYFEKKVELYVDQAPTTPKPNDVIRFVLLLEPPEIINNTYNIDISNNVYKSHQKKYFDYLLTHQEDLLKLISDSYMFEFGTCWIKNYKFPIKSFSVSTLVGWKRMTEGHKLRHQVLINENKINNIPTIFFNSGNQYSASFSNNNRPKITDDKSPLFDSQYHICIENIKRDNWFTEKLIDCLQTKTIPIYYGCPNIGNWFDIRGFLMVDDINDIISTCNKLTPDLYNQMLPFIENNYEKSKEFIDLFYRLFKIMNNLLK